MFQKPVGVCLLRPKTVAFKGFKIFKSLNQLKSAQDMRAPLFESLSQAKVSPEMALVFLKEEVGLLLK